MVNKSGVNIPGLSEAEASERLRSEGYNELPSSKPRSIIAIAFEVVREPMFLLLIAGGILYFALGETRDALMLMGFVLVIIGITFYQERKTERALEALRDLSSPRALVIRDGEERRIAGRDVVRGDILVVREGDRVPADSVVLSSVNLSVDESLLTGESEPACKSASESASEMGRPGGGDAPFIYASTMVVQGYGIARVLATGIHTETGRIGRALQSAGPEETTLQRQTGRLVKRLAAAGLSLCALIVIAYGLTRGDWLKGFLAGITLAMSVLPEEIPVILTVFLALGAWRISRKRVLTRRITAIETLGSATVLCVDKTGTLTENRMSVRRLFAGGKTIEVNDHAASLPEAFHGLVEYGILASQHDPFDPMEKAIIRLGHKYLSRSEHLHKDWALVHQYPLSAGLLALSHVYKSVDGSEYVIAAKGAPEAIAELCHLSETQTEELFRHVSVMAKDGLRVLGAARARFSQPILPSEQHVFDFEFVGLIGLADPVRPAVPDAIKKCRTAGIRVIMITGDNPLTAKSIAKQIGLTQADGCITGPELDGMEQDELQRRIKTVSIFARVLPEQKLRIVEALKAHGEIVAMTGDGVNDAPALKSAHIGVAMGGRGTDVARESSALVLLDDDFSSIVQAVGLGRRILDNIRKALAYTSAIHVPIAGMVLIPVLMKWPLVFLPMHIVFLEMIIDPACSIVFEAEPEEADVMVRPPRDQNEPLFGRRAFILSLLQGVSVLVMVLAVFCAARYLGRGEAECRALAFTTLIVANLGLIFTNRSWSRTIFASLNAPNAALWWVTGGALTFLGMALYVPFLRGLFHFDILHMDDLMICTGAGLLSIVWFEMLKMINGRHGKRAPASQ